MTHCDGDACITCGDVAVEVTVLRLLPGSFAVVDTGQGTREEVSVALVSAAAGDTILVHASEAIAVVRRVEEGAEDGAEQDAEEVSSG